MNKIIIAIGIVVLLNAVLTGILFDKISSILGIQFGGTTNLDSLELSETLTVTGATTQTGALSVAANLNAEGGFIEKGVYDYGEASSISMTATIFCDYRGMTADFDGYNDGTRASISLPDDEDLIADCLANEGYKRFTIDGTSSTSATVFEIVTTGLVFNAASTACSMADNDAGEITSDEIVVLEAYYDGVGSVSWVCDAFTSSTSFQP